MTPQVLNSLRSPPSWSSPTTKLVQLAYHNAYCANVTADYSETRVAFSVCLLVSRPCHLHHTRSAITHLVCISSLLLFDPLLRHSRSKPCFRVGQQRLQVSGGETTTGCGGGACVFSAPNEGPDLSWQGDFDSMEEK